VKTLSRESRRQVIDALPGERGQRLVVLPWWADALTALDNHAIREVILLLVRQAGKSQLLMAMAITELMLVPNSYIVLVAASEAQQHALYHRKLRRPLERVLDGLGQRKAARFTQRGVEIPCWNAALEILAPTEDTTPGRTVTLLLIDEARYIPDAVYVALAPSVLGAGGKIVIASTAGPPSGWFYQLVHHPTPETWIYRSDRNENPCADAGVLNFLQRRLALISPTAARRELASEFVDDGDELIPAALIEVAIDDSLGELPSSMAPAFAFLDLSRKRDLTSLVVVVRDTPRRPEAADHLVTASVQTWNPKDSSTQETDFAEVRAAVAGLLARFPRLERVLVDEGAEAGTVLPWAKAHPRLSLLVEGFTGSVHSNMDLWGALSARLNARTLSIPRHERLLSELRGLRRESFALGSRWRVVDSTRRLHRDVSLALAGAVMAAGELRRCLHCTDDACEWPLPPVGLVGSPTVTDWFARHPDPDAHRLAVASPDKNVEDIDAVLARMEEWVVLVDAGDIPAADMLHAEIARDVAVIERGDAHAGRELREIVGHMRAGEPVPEGGDA
jgi:hypothetical protein